MSGTIACSLHTRVALNRVLAYRHDGVIRRYCQEHLASPAEGKEVFREMLRWLYLYYRGQVDGPEDFACALSPEIEKIDWMWHAFMLFTRDYADFCDRYFGFFLHHVPAEDEPAESVTQAELERQFSFVCRVLGANTLNAWYGDCRFAAH
jgi:hypothetical protein